MEFSLEIILDHANYRVESKGCPADDGGCYGCVGLEVNGYLGVLVPLGLEYKFGITLAP